jgi:translation initiation factor 3 subunit H
MMKINRSNKVKISGLTILKIAEHCRSSFPHIVTGQLLGLDFNHLLEVTDCFPLHGAIAAENMNEDESERFTLELLRRLREINIDSNSVGWYQSVSGSYQTVEVLETFLSYQASLKHCVCLVYDSQATLSYSMPLKAIQLKKSFGDMYYGCQRAQHSLGVEMLRNSDISWNEVFEDLTIEVHNSTLINAMMHTLTLSTSGSEEDMSGLGLEINTTLERNLESLVRTMDDLLLEQQCLSLYTRQVQKIQQSIILRKQRRSLQNWAEGEEPLPEHEPLLHMPASEPNQIDRLLFNIQIATLCEQISNHSTETVLDIKVHAVSAQNRASGP